MVEEHVVKKLNEKSVEGRISCSEARKIAEELKVPYNVIGKAANKSKIKIVRCELGCF